MDLRLIFRAGRIAGGAVLAMQLSGCVVQSEPTGVTFRQAGNTTIISPTSKLVIKPRPVSTYSVVEKGGKKLAVNRFTHQGPAALDGLPMQQFQQEAASVFHQPTGVRLPRAHAGCRLTAVHLGGGGMVGPTDFSRGAIAEYDCGEAQALTYVTIAFERGADEIASMGLVNGLDRIAFVSSQADSGVPGMTCTHMIPNAPVAQLGLTETQCGGKWRKPTESNQQLRGTATVAFGKGLDYIRFTNTCYEDQCTENRPQFGMFISTFDLSSFGSNDERLSRQDQR